MRQTVWVLALDSDTAWKRRRDTEGVGIGFFVVDGVLGVMGRSRADSQLIRQVAETRLLSAVMRLSCLSILHAEGRMVHTRLHTACLSI